jgi:CRP/FNR family transcriptional regulator
VAVEIKLLDQYLPFLPFDLRKDLAAHAEVAEVPAGKGLLQEGQYVRVIPIVLEGLVRVYTQVEDRELLLYYIRPRESCVMSFSAIINNDRSRIDATAEEDSTLLLLPSEKVQEWVRNHPRLNELFFQQYNMRYNELIDTIHHLLFNRLDQRLYAYLREQANLKGPGPLQIRHRKIAQDLGTAREVVTRTLRKLETEGRISLTENGIEVSEG